jgi:hypothetical protein
MIGSLTKRTFRLQINLSCMQKPLACSYLGYDFFIPEQLKA